MQSSSFLIVSENNAQLIAHRSRLLSSQVIFYMIILYIRPFAKGITEKNRTGKTRRSRGKQSGLNGKTGPKRGLVLERSVNADNLEGKWESELLVEKRNG